jgi:hypothetical protein
LLVMTLSSTVSPKLECVGELAQPAAKMPAPSAAQSAAVEVKRDRSWRVLMRVLLLLDRERHARKARTVCEAL